MQALKNLPYKKPFFSRSVCLAAVLAVIFIGCGAKADPQKAPDFTLVDLQGNKFSLSDYKGKVVLLDFWATWCPPCRISTPEVEKFSENYKSSDVVVLGISLDENNDVLQRYVDEHRLTYRMALANQDIQSKYGLSGIPAFYIINKEGYVVRSWGGYHPMMPKIWRSEVEKTSEIISLKTLLLLTQIS